MKRGAARRSLAARALNRETTRERLRVRIPPVRLAVHDKRRHGWRWLEVGHYHLDCQYSRTRQPLLEDGRKKRHTGKVVTEGNPRKA